MSSKKQRETHEIQLIRNATLRLDFKDFQPRIIIPHSCRERLNV
jgi:hypothetical protein